MTDGNIDFDVIGGVKLTTAYDEPVLTTTVFYACSLCGAAIAYSGDTDYTLTRHREWHESSNPEASND